MSDTLHAFLRTETAALHRELEERSSFDRLLTTQSFDTAAYTSVLMDFEEVFSALEPISEGFLRQMTVLDMPPGQADEKRGFDLLKRRVLARNDLAALDHVPRPARAAIGDISLNFRQASPDQLWGLSYVLLGQLMGAAQISASLSRCKGFEPAVIPDTFFCAHIRTGVTLWRWFLARLNHSGALPQEALRGARHAFEAFLLVWPDRTTDHLFSLRSTT